MAGWRALDEVKEWADDHDNFIVEAAGYMIGDSEDFVMLVPMYTRNASNVGHAIVIPQRAIMDMEVIDG
jgi:hypothetical protein